MTEDRQHLLRPHMQLRYITSRKTAVGPSCLPSGRKRRVISRIPPTHWHPHTLRTVQLSLCQALRSCLYVLIYGIPKVHPHHRVSTCRFCASADARGSDASVVISFPNTHAELFLFVYDFLLHPFIHLTIRNLGLTSLFLLN